MEYFRICPVCGRYMNPSVVTTSGTRWTCVCGYQSRIVIDMNVTKDIGELEPITTVAPPISDNIKCKDCINHRKRSNYCDIWHENTPANGYCFRAKQR